MQDPLVQEPLVQEPLVQEPLVQESHPQLDPTLAHEPLEQAMSAPGEVLVCNEAKFVPALGSGKPWLCQRPEWPTRFCACNS